MAGIRLARGRYVIMGDADDSYDFTALDPFLSRFRAGDELVMGNRFAGGIEPGAMPWLHRSVGNPVLSWVGRLFFGVPVHDFHCGLRGFSRDRVLGLGLHTTGMEWASELVVSSGLAGMRISEVPTTLSPDGRTRRHTHLRPIHDGWRHLRFLLLSCPRWLFVYPGLVAFVVGFAGSIKLTVGPVRVGSVGFGIGSLLYMAALTMLGYLALWFGLLAKAVGEKRGFLPAGRGLSLVQRRLTLERGLLGGLVLMLVGGVAGFMSFARWQEAGFGALDGAQTVRTVVPAMLGLVLGAQTVFGSLCWSLLGVENTAGAPRGLAGDGPGGV